MIQCRMFLLTLKYRCHIFNKNLIILMHSLSPVGSIPEPGGLDAHDVALPEVGSQSTP